MCFTQKTSFASQDQLVQKGQGNQNSHTSVLCIVHCTSTYNIVAGINNLLIHKEIQNLA